MAGKFDFNSNFSATIDKFVNKTEEKILAVMKNSVQELVEEASRPERAGGKMHVDTGFLRASGVAALNDIPVGPTEGRKRSSGEEGVLPEYAKYNPSSSVGAVLADMKMGDTFYFGWTARYALYRELYDGFLKSACDNWQLIVNKNIRRLK